MSAFAGARRSLLVRAGGSEVVVGVELGDVGVILERAAADGRAAARRRTKRGAPATVASGKSGRLLRAGASVELLIVAERFFYRRRPGLALGRPSG
jgi:lipid-binding SYLF domain-containing protein